MTTYHPDTLRQLLADDEENITLADELESAIAHTIGKFIGDKQLAVFALANDVMPALVNKLESLDLNRYEVEPVMTTHNEKTPATAPTVNEGTKSIPERSVTTAYLAKRGDNTRHTFGTFSGESVPIKDHITMILPVDAVVQMMDEGPVLVQINPGCLTKHNEHTRKVREEEKRKRHAELRRRIADRITEEEGFEEQLAHIDAQATAIYDQIDKKVDAVLQGQEGKA